jgi:hypothetical protein|tara:strand:+ start:349 stop:522 length:174 start_codon:yes stop_codon:yes gene_type:complete
MREENIMKEYNTIYNTEEVEKLKIEITDLKDQIIKINKRLVELERIDLSDVEASKIN